MRQGRTDPELGPGHRSGAAEVMPATNAALQPYRFVVDMKTGRPCTLVWQQEFGCDLGVATFFAAADCQATRPVLPHIVVGLASDWHRQGLCQVRNRTAAKARKGRT